jgi:hypothetical protein
MSDLERMRGRGGAALTTGIKGSGLGDLKVFAQRWLASKKKANHPLLAGTPMCDEVHEVLGTRVAQPTTAYLNLNPGFYWFKPRFLLV